MRVRSLSALVGFLFATALIVAVPASAQRTEGLDEARARVERLSQEIADAETELSKLELRALGAETELERLETEAEGLATSVTNAAILDFTRSGSGRSIFSSGDLTDGIRAGTLTDAAIGADTDALETYAVLFEDLELARIELAESKAAHDEFWAELLEKREELGAELARLEAIEAERLAEERRRAAAEAAAAAAASRSSGGGGGSANATAAAPGGLLTYCPVAGTHSFIDSWGYPRSGGRRHKGVDIMANTGVPIVAPVSGTVSHRSNRVGGRSFHLNGDDGNYYYGTHLSAYGNSGRVNAGDLIGYVGDDGNAAGIPHLHFEIHPGGGAAVNPYPATRAACG